MSIPIVLAGEIKRLLTINKMSPTDLAAMTGIPKSELINAMKLPETTPVPHIITAALVSTGLVRESTRSKAVAGATGKRGVDIKTTITGRLSTFNPKEYNEYLAKREYERRNG